MIYVWLIQGRSPRMLLMVDVKHIVETLEESKESGMFKLCDIMLLVSPCLQIHKEPR